MNINIYTYTKILIWQKYVNKNIAEGIKFYIILLAFIFHIMSISTLNMEKYVFYIFYTLIMTTNIIINIEKRIQLCKLSLSYFLKLNNIFE